MDIWTILNLPYGRIRRDKIVLWLSDYNNPYGINGIPINRKWQIRDSDPDLKKLIKRGILMRIREGLPTSRQTWLVLNETLSCNNTKKS